MKVVCKRVFYIFLLLLLCASLAGCGGNGTKDYQIDETDFMSEMLNQVSFDCDMYQVKPESVENFFTLEDGTTAIVFMGNGSYADHAGIFTSPDEETAAKTLEMVQTYVEDLKHSFEDYLPEGENSLCTLKKDEIAMAEYWVYLEGCDTECYNPVQSRNLTLQLSFTGDPVEEKAAED